MWLATSTGASTTARSFVLCSASLAHLRLQQTKSRAENTQAWLCVSGQLAVQKSLSMPSRITAPNAPYCAAKNKNTSIGTEDTICRYSGCEIILYLTWIWHTRCPVAGICMQNVSCPAPIRRFEENRATQHAAVTLELPSSGIQVLSIGDEKKTEAQTACRKAFCSAYMFRPSSRIAAL